jgi:hypothetical protein
VIHALGYFENVLLTFVEYECFGRWILETKFPQKIDILRELSMKANVTTLKCTCKTN